MRRERSKADRDSAGTLLLRRDRDADDGTGRSITVDSHGANKSRDWEMISDIFSLAEAHTHKTLLYVGVENQQSRGGGS